MAGPIMTLLADGKPRHKKQLAEHMIAEFNLTKEEQAQTVPSGDNKIYKSYLDMR